MPGQLDVLVGPSDGDDGHLARAREHPPPPSGVRRGYPSRSGHTLGILLSLSFARHRPSEQEARSRLGEGELRSGGELRLARKRRRRRRRAGSWPEEGGARADGEEAGGWETEERRREHARESGDLGCVEMGRWSEGGRPALLGSRSGQGPTAPAVAAAAAGAARRGSCLVFLSHRSCSSHFYRPRSQAAALHLFSIDRRLALNVGSSAGLREPLYARPPGRAEPRAPPFSSRLSPSLPSPSFGPPAARGREPSNTTPGRLLLRG